MELPSTTFFKKKLREKVKDAVWEDVQKYGRSDLKIAAAREAILNSSGTLTVENLVVSAQTNVTTQSFIVTSIGNLILSEDGQTLAPDPGAALVTTENYNAVTIGANTGSWYFKSQGVLQLPPGGDIQDSNGASVLGGGAGGGSAYSVNYTSQSLTTSQKSQARANIDAISTGDAFLYSLIF
jgi:hypothetical protein